jgi:hypothetical protein
MIFCNISHFLSIRDQFIPTEIVQILKIEIKTWIRIYSSEFPEAFHIGIPNIVTNEKPRVQSNLFHI